MVVSADPEAHVGREDEYRFTAFHRPSGNCVLWGPTLDATKADIEAMGVNPAGIVIIDSRGEVPTFEYFGPLVTP